jgi:hypothetical protein
MNAYDPARLKTLLAACESATGAHARGSALEDLVQHIFAATPSVTLYRRDVKDQDGTQEVDLVFSHLQHVSLLPIPDVTIIVECKNERRKATSEQITRFGTKLRTRNAKIGIFVTAAGLSGKNKPAVAAHAAIRDELSAGASIIVVTAAELAAVTSSDELAVLLRDRLLELHTFRNYQSL